LLAEIAETGALVGSRLVSVGLALVVGHFGISVKNENKKNHVPL
jgi:hypothetical protein